MENQITEKKPDILLLLLMLAVFSSYGFVNSIEKALRKQIYRWILIRLSVHTFTHTKCGSVGDDDEMAK